MTSRLIFRMTAPVVATALLLLIVGVGAAWYIHHLQYRVSNELKANVSSLWAAEELMTVLHEIDAHLDKFLLTGDRQYLNEVPPLQAKMEPWLEKAEHWSNSANDQEMIAKARKGQQHFFEELNKLLALPDGSFTQKVDDLKKNVLSREVLQPTQNYLAGNVNESDESWQENQSVASQMVYVLLILGICGSGAGLIAGFGFARAFQRSLVQLSLPIRTAAGHLDEVVGPITFAAHPDLHEMESTLQLISDRVGAMVERLRQSERDALRAEQLAAVGQMAAGMAHELRNPLTSMKILVQAGLTSNRDLLVIEEEITRLERLVQTFLEFAQPPRPERRPLDINELVSATVKMIAQRASRRATAH